MISSHLSLHHYTAKVTHACINSWATCTPTRACCYFAKVTHACINMIMDYMYASSHMLLLR